MTTCNPILYFCSIVSHMGGCCSYGRVLLFYDFVPTYKKKISFSTITWKKKKVWGEEGGLGRRGLPCILHATVIMPGSKNRDFIFPLRKTLFKKALYKGYPSSEQKPLQKDHFNYNYIHFYQNCQYALTNVNSIRLTCSSSYQVQIASLKIHLLIVPLDMLNSAQVLCSKAAVHNQAVYNHRSLPSGI